MNVNSIYENFKSSCRLCWYYIFAYILPLFIVFACCLLDSGLYKNFVSTLMRMDNYVNLLIAGPIVVLMIGSLIFTMFAFVLTRNHAISTSTIKCYEDIRIGCSKSLIRWILLLIVLLSLTWITGLVFLCFTNSLLVALLFAILSTTLSLFVCIFCVLKIENVQHSRLFRHLSFPFCNEESQISSTKNSTTSDVYSTRPVVTQVTSTQVNGMTLHTPMGHSPSTPTATSPVSMSPCLPQTHPLPIVRYTPFSYPGIASRQRASARSLLFLFMFCLLMN